MCKVPSCLVELCASLCCLNWSHFRFSNSHKVRSTHSCRVTLSSMKEMKSPFSAYFKIMTNHLHLILLTASFDLSWPQVISDFFSSTEPVANVADRIISIDCFMDASGTDYSPLAFNRVPRPYMYLLIYLFMPFFIVLVSLAIWGFIYPRKRVTMCNRTITTSIILLFLVHPSITTLLIRVFQ